MDSYTDRMISENIKAKKLILTHRVIKAIETIYHRCNHLLLGPLNLGNASGEKRRLAIVTPLIAEINLRERNLQRSLSHQTHS